MDRLHGRTFGRLLSSNFAATINGTISDTINWTVYDAIRWTVSDTINWTVYDTKRWTISDAVDWTVVSDAVGWDIFDAIHWQQVIGIRQERAGIARWRMWWSGCGSGSLLPHHRRSVGSVERRRKVCFVGCCSDYCSSGVLIEAVFVEQMLQEFLFCY